MAQITCPYCEKDVEIESSSFPPTASEVAYIDCPKCEEMLELSWYAIFEARKVDICGLCGEPGADKIPHPMRWPGEKKPETDFVHAECEKDECARAHAELSESQIRKILSSI